MSTTCVVDEPRQSTAQTSEGRPHVAAWILGVSIACLLGVAVWFRVWHLGNIPGVNGDEAEYGVRAIRFLRGEPIPWHTPTKNWVNPFYFVPQVVLHAVAPPSFVLLRLTAVVSGLLALVLNYFFCRRVFDRQTAIVSTTLLAVLPINIAYSRFGWDTCQTLAASLLVIYPSLLAVREPRNRGRWTLRAILGLGVAYLVHPTNVFLGAFLLAALIVERSAAWRSWVAGGRRQFVAGIVAIASLGGAYWFARHVMRLAPADLTGPVELGEFVRNYLRLFSGTTIYRYIPGSLQPTADAGSWDVTWLDGVALIVAIGLIVTWMRYIRVERQATDRVLLWGWGLGLAGFFVVAGTHALEPHWERYGMCLVGAGALVLSRGLVALFERGGRVRELALAGSILCGASLLVQFQWNYFRHFEQTGGSSQATFRTAAWEPKLTTWRIVQQQRDPAQMAWLVVPQWWNYWPLAYLAAHDPNVRVVDWDEAGQDGSLDAALLAGQVWFIEYSDSEAWTRWHRWLQSAEGEAETTTVRDFAGRPHLSIERATRSPERVLYQTGMR